MTTRILLVDDHEIFVEGLRGLLEKQDDLEVVGEAQDGRSAVQMAKELAPDLVTMDITMPGLNDIEATRMIVADGGTAQGGRVGSFAERVGRGGAHRRHTHGDGGEGIPQPEGH